MTVPSEKWREKGFSKEMTSEMRKGGGEGSPSRGSSDTSRRAWHILYTNIHICTFTPVMNINNLCCWKSFIAPMHFPSHGRGGDNIIPPLPKGRDQGSWSYLFLLADSRKYSEPRTPGYSGSGTSIERRERGNTCVLRGIENQGDQVLEAVGRLLALGVLIGELEIGRGEPAASAKHRAELGLQDT